MLKALEAFVDPEAGSMQFRRKLVDAIMFLQVILSYVHVCVNRFSFDCKITSPN
jgi:hypothetical protein